ncbi:Long-chain-fatty-acid--CoA ligase ACSBG2 [Cryptotermes secundus]|uniref:long-chain-fatty-acid--CoA ligase n=1 Tax=Cryptotermes secundus TaxID=105785 RepID=A0A2J7Q6C4_9NEOP|nr:very long-chain-fatty-acid--CoA ligase bubblegum [Cryptotermes secundus]XP_023716898.1 very long-chain-fatty-acid--CoA ligase bubblegum [Cryptotermes secundus]XP_023716899.1 very long-chain-fatty-acid--CoA ligase bubblegum [Cryptotermes secundus]PNF24131.1 Long-chain-fatty-acid--CoA ligase ACSBG2 [Cryptotermes secundus]
MNETGDEIVEHEQRSTSFSKTSTIMKFSKQNGANGIGITDHILSNGISSVNNNQLNGPELTARATLTAGSSDPEVRDSHVQTTISAENADLLNGPDQVLPATGLFTSNANGRVKIRCEESGMGTREPISVPGLLHKIAQEYPNHPALVSKREDGQWKEMTYKEYEASVRTCAKGFLKLGLKRYHSVCILGFNSPEWFFSYLGAMYAGGFAAGIYTTNSSEACYYCAVRSYANIIVVEDKKQLDKILDFKDKLPELKAIVQYHDKPEVEGVISWEELMKLGRGEPDVHLNNVLKTIGVNECCSIVFTSGTVGNPKAAMLSHDNFTWDAKTIAQYMGVSKGNEVLVSFLPLSHVAAQILDFHISIAAAATVYFADKDALKGSLVKTLQEVRPTRFLAVPRVWEKIYEKMQEIGRQSGVIKRAIATWAKGHGLQHYLDKMNGIDSNTFSYMLAKRLIFSRIKQALGLDRCVTALSGAAPISVDIKKYFWSIDIPLMDAFGMTETTGGHTLNNEKEFRLEATGKKRDGVYSKIMYADEDQQGEVCINGRHVFMGYLDDPEKTSEVFDEEGWLHTGDLGKIDENDFLYLTGRIKELIITAGGENIAPVLIEEEVKAQLPCLSNAMLIGDRKKFLSILLTLKTEMNLETGEPLEELAPVTKQWCKELGLEASTVKDVLNGANKQVMDAIQKGIDQANAKAISNAQRVQKFQILPHDFSIPTGEIGPTMKLKRNVVLRKYADIIERFYQET